MSWYPVKKTIPTHWLGPGIDVRHLPEMSYDPAFLARCFLEKFVNKIVDRPYEVSTMNALPPDLGARSGLNQRLELIG